MFIKSIHKKDYESKSKIKLKTKWQIPYMFKYPDGELHSQLLQPWCSIISYQVQKFEIWNKFWLMVANFHIKNKHVTTPFLNSSRCQLHALEKRIHNTSNHYHGNDIYLINFPPSYVYKIQRPIIISHSNSTLSKLIPPRFQKFIIY